eukprot:TRINITY_DN730_c0_g1_i5.p1 TRINITY_DN730_c0_g1~~TRINITY_DN730_c0_g1_i5.p1  ORF type:complete len:652 (-),score=48.44 TRINITY_DN730_c0_g1_i5:10-1965(-)
MALTACYLEALLKDVLDFEKIAQGKFQLDVQEVNLPRFLEELLEITSTHQNSDNQVELLCEISDQVPNIVLADQLRVRQILTNLLSNALRFTTSGSVRVIVSNDDLNDDYVMLRVSVVDTGIGIVPSKQKLLFTPFSNIHDSKLPASTGLGLAICKRLVEAMEGNIGVHSSPGRGSTFWFHIPLKLAPGNTVSPPRRTHQLSPPRQLAAIERMQLCQLKGLSVLLAERSETVRNFVRSHLELWEMVVEEKDSAEAVHARLLDAVVQGVPDLLIINNTLLTAEVIESSELARSCNSRKGTPGLQPAVRILTIFESVAEAFSTAFENTREHATVSKPLITTQLRRGVLRAVLQNASLGGLPQLTPLNRNSMMSWRSFSVASAASAVSDVDEDTAATSKSEGRRNTRNSLSISALSLAATMGTRHSFAIPASRTTLLNTSPERTAPRQEGDSISQRRSSALRTSSQAIADRKAGASVGGLDAVIGRGHSSGERLCDRNTITLAESPRRSQRPTASLRTLHLTRERCDSVLVLIVEPYKPSAYINRSIVQRFGARVIEASCGETAITAMAQQLADIVLLDFDLGDSNVFDVARKLLELNPSAKIIGVGDDKQMPDSERCYECGILVTISRPILHQKLHAAFLQLPGVAVTASVKN